MGWVVMRDPQDAERLLSHEAHDVQGSTILVLPYHSHISETTEHCQDGQPVDEEHPDEFISSTMMGLSSCTMPIDEVDESAEQDFPVNVHQMRIVEADEKQDNESLLHVLKERMASKTMAIEGVDGIGKQESLLEVLKERINSKAMPINEVDEGEEDEN
jgi:hypothetical protein